MRLSNFEQREMDAKMFAQDDNRRAIPAPSPRPRLPTVTVPRDTDLDDDILDAMTDASCNAEGHMSPYYLRRHLAERGLVIVEASRLGSLALRAGLVDSVRADLDKLEG